MADEARAELAKLQRGDAENLAAWQHMVDATRDELDASYARLGVTFDLWRGESAYEEMLPDVVKMLLERGIAREDEGAICVFFEDDPELAKIKTPFIVRKKDGAFLYSTTDIATVLWRRDHSAHRARDCTWSRRARSCTSSSCSRPCASSASRWSSSTSASARCWARTASRSRRAPATAIKLAALLDEAEQRATKLIPEEGLDIEPERVPALARSVGIGAVKYADLSQNRSSDYKFDWDKMISFKGNAGPYLQYAHARIAAIFRKGGIDANALRERGAALARARQPRSRSASSWRASPTSCTTPRTSSLPHLVCEHLYALAR